MPLKNLGSEWDTLQSSGRLAPAAPGKLPTGLHRAEDCFCVILLKYKIEYVVCTYIYIQTQTFQETTRYDEGNQKKQKSKNPKPFCGARNFWNFCFPRVFFVFQQKSKDSHGFVWILGGKQKTRFPLVFD